MLKPGQHYTLANGQSAYVRMIENGVAYGSIHNRGLASWHAQTGIHLQASQLNIVKEVSQTVVFKAANAALEHVYPKVTKAGVSPWCWYDRVGYTGPISFVLHATSAPGEAIDTYNYFMGQESGCCTHFVVGRQGEVYQCADPMWAAAGNCCPSAHVGDWWPSGVNGNFYTVSLEIQKAPGNQEVCSAAQFQAVCEVLDWVCGLCHIKRVYAHDKTGGIITHSDFDPVHRPGGNDPGPFDMTSLLRYINRAMAELKNYPIINQRNSPTTDNQPDENKEYNCVAANTCAAIWYYRPDLRNKLWPDTLKDAVLGQGATGGTAIQKFVQYVHDTYRIRLYPYFNNSPLGLISQAHIWIRSGQPAIFTEIDPYSDDPNLWHVGTFFKEVLSGLVLMDTYGGLQISKTDGQWAAVAQSGAIWTAVNDMITFATPGVAQFFESDSVHPTWWHLKNSDKYIHGAILEYYRSWPSTGVAGLTEFGLPKTNEVAYERDNTGAVDYCYQVFERGAIAYDPKRKHDNPVGSVGSCYHMHTDRV